MNNNMYDLVLWWTRTFPIDKEYRRKYNIPFGSKKHKKTDIIDMLFDMTESYIFSIYIDDLREQESKENQLKAGVWLGKTVLTDEEDEDLWDDINIDTFNQ
jgi:hypothetical protein